MTPEALEAAVADITTTRAAELPAWFHCLTYLCRRAIAFAETRQYAVARLMRELRAAAA
jgi:hypothetical protein